MQGLRYREHVKKAITDEIDAMVVIMTVFRLWHGTGTTIKLHAVAMYLQTMEGRTVIHQAPTE